MVCLWLVVFTTVDAAVLALPFQPTMAEWRYRLAAHLALYVFSPMMGVFLALALAVVFEQPRVLRAVGVLSGLACVGLLLFLLSHMADSFPLRGIERVGLVPPFSSKWGVVVFKLGVAVVFFGAITLVARGLASGRASNDRAAPGLVAEGL
jgi:hypothetical protein